jgi:hypothetical protein
VLQSGTNVAVRQSVFADNKAAYAAADKGISIKASASGTRVAVDSCTFYGNEVVSTGAPPAPSDLGRGLSLLCDSGATCTLRNSISWDGAANSAAATARVVAISPATLGVAFSDVLGGGGWAGSNGNIQVNPRLDASYTPAANSSVVDAGNPVYSAPDATDWLRNPRVRNGTVDMGAVEVQQGSLPPISGGGGGGGAGSGGGGGTGIGGGGSSGNRAPALVDGFEPAFTLGKNQV